MQDSIETLQMLISMGVGGGVLIILLIGTAKLPSRISASYNKLIQPCSVLHLFRVSCALYIVHVTHDYNYHV